MHVVLFFTYEISLKEWSDSGLLDRELKLYKKLSSKYGLKFTFITYGNKTDFGIIEENPLIEVLPIYTLINKSKNKIIRFSKSFYIPFYIKKNIKDFDIIKTNQLHGSWVAIILKIISKKRLYIRTGYNHFSFARKEGKGFLKKAFFYYLTKLALLSSDYYSVTSKSDKKTLIKNFNIRNKAKIKVIPNWVEPVDQIDNKYSDRVLSVGRLEKQKNYISLIKELSDSNFSLDIAGEGSLKEELIECAKKYNVKINLLGLFSNEELMSIYGKYKIFVSSSLYEGNPKALLEAMAMGCVVISTKTTNVEEIIEDNINGRFYSFENKDLQSIIKEVIEDYALYKRLSNNAIKSVSIKNSFQNTLNKELKIYNLLISS